MASSSSGSRRYDVFPSFSGEDVRKSFLSHLLKELDRKSIRTFRDHGIERSRPIGPELLLAIRESRIAIVIFSKKYASSTWCLNELVEIHKCYKELNQMVIPIFYKVNPSEVGKQTGDFGKVFKETCEGKLEDQKQIWMQTLADVAKMAGEDLQNWPDEAAMIEKITNDVFNKLITPSQRFGDFLGIETHIEAMKPMLSLESEEAIMVGILGPSGIGKTTIARALFSQLSSQFHYHAFVSYKRTQRDDYGMKLFWEKQFLSEILDQKDLKLCHFGMVEQKLNHKKVLIVLDDVDDLELLKTLVGKTGWFGPGSLIIVITQDRRLLKAHEIDLIYEVEFPSKDLALKMLSRSAFGQNSPPGDFMELAVEMAELAGNLPLGLSVLGSSLKGSSKGKWIEMMPRLRNDLDGDIEKTLRLSYDRLARQDDRELFLYIACFLRLSEGIGFYERTNVGYIIEFFGDSVNNGLTMLADKSLIRITSNGTIEMHNLLQRLGRRIVRAESNDNNPGKHVFLVDVEDIREVLTEKTGTESVQGIYLNKSDIIEPFFIYKKSFKGMLNLQFLIVCTDRRQDGRQEREGGLYLPQGLAYLPRKLRLLYWSEYPSKCLPSNFKAEFLVELTMVDSKLEKLWEGTQPLGRLKRMFMNGSRYLKEIPDLSKAINLEELYLCECESLVTLTSSIQNAIKLRELNMENCTKLESIPALLNLESLESLKLKGCFQLRNFPQVSLYKLIGQTHETMIKVEDCLWNKNHHGVDFLDSLMRCIPSQFRPEHLKYLTVKGSMLEKLWEGVQSLGKLKKLELLECGNLKEIPDLSKATNLETLKIIECTGLEILPTDVNLSSLKTLDLRGCKRLRSFPQISWNIIYLYLNDTAIEEVPCCIENFWRLNYLWMRGCKRLKNISPNIFRLKRLKGADFSECVEVVTALSYASMVETTEDHSSLSENIFDDHLPNKYFWRIFFSYGFKFNNCFNLDGDARELILRSFLRPTFLPGGNVPKYFTHRSSTNSLTVTLPQSSLSQEFLGFKACVVLEAITNPKAYAPYLEIHWHFRGVYGWHHKSLEMDLIYNPDHLVLVPFKLAPPSKLELDYISSSSKWDYNDVEFWFFLKGHSGPLPSQRIKGCGIRVLDLSPSPASSDESKMPML